eukprot:CAMPEP_0194483502 /NCGR_PEP_ID=MMETSP0253-20130528/5086_1 /TAXON_ID=2966 /ORGANISM="Noctiluca scintillans" /LENGTH=403 /DNA_ID=CAMNT_0039323169 /DNA_START=48 /DNA_END=1259 /DNA_ORIENTATION=-
MSCVVRMIVASAMPFLALGAASRAHLRGDELRTDSRSMSFMYPFYHTTKKINEELTDLATRCPGMTLETRSSPSGTDAVELDVVTIKGGENAINKNFLLFGEHSRELISPESGLHFIKSLCGETELSDRAAKALKTSEFQVVVNANPRSRKLVEEGDFCLRVNEDGVDLNRNWDEMWQGDAVMDPSDTNPGPKPFSEPETQILKSLVEEYRPTNFLTVHSGTRGMYMPWAFDMEHLADRNQLAMMEILEKLDSDYCQCPFGAAGREVGYSCPGTCLDYVYDKLKTPFSFAFEIFVNPDSDEMLKERWQQKMLEVGAAPKANTSLVQDQYKDFFDQHPSSFLQIESDTKRGNGMSDGQCFAQFNPEEEELFHKTLRTWTSAYLDMADMVVENLQKGSSREVEDQ